MATLTTELGKPKQNGYRKVMIILSQHGVRKRIPTSIEVAPSEITKTRIGEIKIKSPKKQLILDGLTKELKEKIYELEEKMVGEYITVEIMHDYLTGKGHAGEPDFFQFSEDWIARSQVKDKKTYSTILNTLERHLGSRNLPFSKINYSLLKGFEEFLKDKPRAQSMYLGLMRHLYHEAMLRYNDDNQTLIKGDPFVRYKVPRQQMKKGVRSLTLEQLIKVYRYEGRPGSRAQLARDCFILSFCLMGMNTVDMYTCTDIKDGVLRYNRAKTKDRRSDGAYIEVTIQPFIKELVRKYRGDGRVFNFSERYSCYETFNQNVNIGLKDVGKAVGIDDLEFYQARHTFATLSRNLMRFSKSDVDEALNHVGTLEIADVYIKKDFSIINDNNAKLLERVFVLKKKPKK